MYHMRLCILPAFEQAPVVSSVPANVIGILLVPFLEVSFTIVLHPDYDVV